MSVLSAVLKGGIRGSDEALSLGRRFVSNTGETVARNPVKTIGGTAVGGAGYDLTDDYLETRKSRAESQEEYEETRQNLISGEYGLSDDQRTVALKNLSNNPPSGGGSGGGSFFNSPFFNVLKNNPLAVLILALVGVYIFNQVSE